MCGYFIHCQAAIFLHDAFKCCDALWCHHSVAWPGRSESVTELMPFMNFSVHSYTCCTDRHASPYWTFIRRWISVSFTASLRCSSSEHTASGAAVLVLLLRCRVAFLHRTDTCRQLFNPSVTLLSTYRKIDSVSNFYRTFNVFIWISLVNVLPTVFWDTLFSQWHC
jgi:hypothetical protein